MNSQTSELQKLITSQHPEKADSIVWLQGNGYDRGAKVLELYRAHYAPRIVVTGNNTRVVEHDAVCVQQLVFWLKEHGVSEKEIILDDQALNTYDQAVHVIALARMRAWSAMLLVGSTHHQLRAFLTFLHQAHEQKWYGRIVNQPVHTHWDVPPSGRRETTGEAFEDELRKIAYYHDDVASIEEGLAYANQHNAVCFYCR